MKINICIVGTINHYSLRFYISYTWVILRLFILRNLYESHLVKKVCIYNITVKTALTRFSYKLEKYQL